MSITVYHAGAPRTFNFKQYHAEVCRHLEPRFCTFEQIDMCYRTSMRPHDAVKWIRRHWHSMAWHAEHVELYDDWDAQLDHDYSMDSGNDYNDE